MEFDYRADDDSGLMYFGDYEPGTSLSQSIEPGDEVTLKVGGSRVNVTVGTINGNAYEGSVSRFIDDPDALDDLDVGDDVEFFHSNIWARHRS
ncbi:hypothetical protein [Marinobacter sp. 1_MG-2023]|uniref:hypothetical protein n=1 Tax=Marinobacter sp. 1_MG-2023 TaxID=3062627 RepID=UPI0026E1F68C|nr:hypothetical protein [Marinobacter sp. 1_MG-2023]MDO6825612.1 hypothetical protein [Marinobacter sp. 1_MG-2023]